MGNAERVTNGETMTETDGGRLLLFAGTEIVVGIVW